MATTNHGRAECPVLHTCVTHDACVSVVYVHANTSTYRVCIHIRVYGASSEPRAEPPPAKYKYRNNKSRLDREEKSKFRQNQTERFPDGMENRAGALFIGWQSELRTEMSKEMLQDQNSRELLYMLNDDQYFHILIFSCKILNSSFSFN